MVYLIGLVTAISTFSGGLVAYRVKDRKHLALGLAGGLMLGVVFFDIVPESLRLSHGFHGVSWAMLALVGGFVLLNLIERFHHSHTRVETLRHHANPGMYALLGHSFLDGLGIALAFQASHALGILFSVAVIAHDMGDGFNMVMLSQSKRALLANSLAPLSGVLVGTSFSLPPVVLGPVLGLFGGSLLYLATSDILPEAHASHPTKLTFLFTAAGAAIMFALIGILG